MALASAGSALAAPSWLGKTNLSTPGFGVFGPEVASTGSGETIATWYGTDNVTGEHVQYATRPRGGSWTPAVTLSGDSGYNPDLAVTPNGTAVIVWEFDPEEGLGEPTYLEYSVRQGGTWSPAQPMPKGGNRLSGAYFPKVAVNSSGDALAIWQQCYSGENEECFNGPSSTSHPKYLVRASRRPAGGSWSTPETLSSQSEAAVKLEPAIDASGDAAVAWEDENVRAHVALRRAGSGSWSNHELSGAAVSGSPEVAFSNDGTATVVWDEVTGGHHVLAETAAPGSTAWSAAQTISGNVDGFQPRLAVAPDGDAVAAWEPVGSSPAQAAVRSGGVWGPAQNLSPEGTSGDHPRVAINDSGTALAVWRAGGGGVQGASHPAGGSWSAASDVTGSATGASETAVAVDPEGNGVAIWRAAGEGEFAQAAGYDGAAPRLDGVSIPSAATVGQTVSFAASPSDAWSGVAATSWSFGDGSGASGAAVSHAFGAAGSYQVTVTSTDALGIASSASGTVTVNAAAAPAPPSGPHLARRRPGVAHFAGHGELKNGRALLTVSCSKAGRCAGVAKVNRGGKVVGKAPFALAAGHSKTLAITLAKPLVEQLAEIDWKRTSVRIEGSGLKPQKVVLRP